MAASEHQLQVALSSIREELDSLLEEREKLREELRIIRTTIASRIETVRAIRNELRSLREQLNTLRNELENLRTKRNELRDLLQKLRVRSRELYQALRTGYRIPGNPDELRRRVEELEWRLITTPNLSLEEEKQIVQEIAFLEHRLAQYIRSQRALSEYSREYENVVAEANSVRNEIIKLSKHMNELRKQIGELKRRREELRKQLEVIINDLQELKKKRRELKNSLQDINSKMAKLRQQYREILAQLRKLSEESEVEKSRKILEVKRKRALEKMRRGERLTLEELYLLLGASGNEQH